MNRNIVILTVLLLALACPAFGMSEEVERWTAGLESDLVADQRQALAALRALAAGELSDPATREAAVAIAEFWVNQDELDLEAAQREIEAVISLFPEHHKTPVLCEALARAQFAAGDRLGGHLAFTRLMELAPDAVSAELMADGMLNAAEVGDAVKVIEWSDRIDVETLEPEALTRFHVARMHAGRKLGRYEIALEALRWFDAANADALEVNAELLRLAGEIEENLGLLDDAIGRYRTVAVLHKDHPEQPAALYALSRLLIRTGRTEEAVPVLTELIERHPDSESHRAARLDLVEIVHSVDGRLPDRYIELIETAESLAEVRQICERFAERFLGAGLPLEMFAALSNLATTTDPGEFPSLAARNAAAESYGPVVQLLHGRGDELGIAVASIHGERMDLTVPPKWEDVIAEVRDRYGFDPIRRGQLVVVLEAIEPLVKQENWVEIIERLEQALDFAPTEMGTTRATVLKRLAEAHWRNGDSRTALRWIERLMERPEWTDREALVLLGDVLFSKGSRAKACRAYGQAAGIEPSRWVDLQLERCRSVAVAGSENETDA